MRTSGSAYKVMEQKIKHGQAITIPTAPVKQKAPQTTKQKSPRVAPEAAVPAPSPPCIDLTIIPEDNATHDRYRHQFRTYNGGVRNRSWQDPFRARGQASIRLRQPTKTQGTQTEPVHIVEDAGLTRSATEPVRANANTAYNKLREYIFG